MSSIVATQYLDCGSYQRPVCHWAENLPAHWQVKALKHGSQIVLGKMLCSVDKGGYHFKPYLKSRNIQWLSVNLDDVDYMWFSSDELKRYRLATDDLIVSEGGEVGKTCIWNDELEECYIQNAAHKVTMGGDNHPRFFLYLLYAMGKSGIIDSVVDRVSIAHLTTEKLSNLRVVFPPSAEQRAIAAFLEEKCAKVDEAVRIKEEQIALLRERRQILIQEAVTRGLNPDTPMQDSGIDWIGPIPAHWEVENPKWLFKHRKERARKGEQQLAATQKYGVIPQSDFMEIEGRRVTQVFLDFDILKHVEAGDFVMSMRSFQGGLEYSEHTGCVSSAYVALEPGPRIFAPFYKYLLKSARYIEALQSTSNLVRDGQALRFDNFAMVMLPALPIEEQKEIAELLDSELLKSDAGISIKERQIAALTEYKTTLINAAVTGKIKVA